MIGREVYNFTELFEWLFSKKGKSIEGYNKVLYSGVTICKNGKNNKINYKKSYFNVRHI